MALTWAVILSACTAPSTGPGRAVPPGYLFAGRYLDITAPNSAGWRLVSEKPDLWAFARNGSEPDETYIASVATFDLPAAISRDDFVALVRRNAERDSNPDRFKDVRSTVELSYPCVHYQATAEDTQAKTRTGDRRPLVFEMVGLYCQDVLLRDMGFAAIYSHRGNTADPQFQKDAADFVAGIRVPGH
ncbi:MAG TPA: hypothetical protein VMT54_17820 [Candidatus Cybelea sp.]|nr:hypothetical protein [Candidatus Cybelea sp.]